MSAPFHFVVFLRLFLIGEALLPWYGVINYQQRVIAVYINYVSRPSPHCAFMFHGCITSSDMKYLLWHVPVTLISPIRCNFLLFLWKIAGKCDQSAGCRRQPAAILNPVECGKKALSCLLTFHIFHASHFSTTAGFKIAAGCRRQPALWWYLPAIFHGSNRKYIYWSAKSTSLEHVLVNISYPRK